MQKIIAGGVVALGLASVAFALNAAPAKPNAVHAASTPAAAPVSQIAPTLRPHLTPGAKIYAGDTVIASVNMVDDTTGNVVIAEMTTVGKLPPLKHVIAASAISWSNGKLVADLNKDKLAALPTY